MLHSISPSVSAHFCSHTWILSLSPTYLHQNSKLLKGLENGCKLHSALQYPYVLDFSSLRYLQKIHEISCTHTPFSTGKWQKSTAAANFKKAKTSFLCRRCLVSENDISFHDRCDTCSMFLQKCRHSSFQRFTPLNGVVKSTKRAAGGDESVALPAGDAILARDDLLGLISGEERGLRTQKDAQKRASIIRVIDALTKLGENSITTDSSSLSATWRMLWTTEKEQLFIIEKAPLFGTQAGDNLQVIEIEKGILNNIITFPPSGAFVVGSTAEVVSNQRVKFRFQSAILYTAKWKFKLPPFGQGWFDSIYLDDKIRVAKDIRGDFLVVDRASYAFEGLRDV